MIFDLDRRTASLSAGEFANFTLGPHDAGSGGASGLWRARLGTHWHNELRSRAAAETPTAEFEVVIAGRVFHRGWTLTLTGRIDQLLLADAAVTLREIKTVTRPLPTDEHELRAGYPEYFVQLASYVTLRRIADPAEKIRGELVFVEAGSGLAQTVSLTPAMTASSARNSTASPNFSTSVVAPASACAGCGFIPRSPLCAPVRRRRSRAHRDLRAPSASALRAPTGFGKTGVLLEFALGQLRAGHFDRALYLTSKSTGQLQVVRTLAAMTAPTPPPDVCHPLIDNPRLSPGSRKTVVN